MPPNLKCPLFGNGREIFKLSINKLKSLHVIQQAIRISRKENRLLSMYIKCDTIGFRKEVLHGKNSNDNDKSRSRLKG
jgi:histidyl-tRNA synthetase